METYEGTCSWETQDCLMKQAVHGQNMQDMCVVQRWNSCPITMYVGISMMLQQELDNCCILSLNS